MHSRYRQPDSITESTLPDQMLMHHARQSRTGRHDGRPHHWPGTVTLHNTRTDRDTGGRDLEHLIEHQLIRDWVVRIEHSDAVERYSTHWQQWGNAMLPNGDTDRVIDAIMACHAEYPASSIRLNAEKIRPRSQLLYWVHRHDEGNHGVVMPARSKPVLHRESANSGNWMSAMKHLISGATSSFASLMTLLGMLIASLLLIEMAIAQ